MLMKQVKQFSCFAKQEKCRCNKIGDKLKGSSHNPFISNKSLRSKYKDKSLKNRVHINEFKIGILYDLNNKPRSLVLKLLYVHAVDSEEELRIHLDYFLINIIVLSLKRDLI